MCFEHNLDYVQNSSHLTRWIAPLPLQYTSSIVLTSPNKVIMDKTKKMSNATGTFQFHPSLRQPKRHTEAQTCMPVAPDSLHLCSNFHL